MALVQIRRGHWEAARGRSREHQVFASATLGARTFAPMLKFGQDPSFKADSLQMMVTELGFGVQWYAPYQHSMHGEAERPIRTLVEAASTMMHTMNAPTWMWPLAMSAAKLGARTHILSSSWAVGRHSLSTETQA